MSSKLSAEERRGRICAVIRQIPAGRVSSYGRIAEMAGFPRGARLAAKALRDTPRSEGLPWFRVLRADGRIAEASVHGGHDEQIALLTADGVLVSNGKVDMERYGWMVSVDEQIWGLDPLADDDG